MHRLQRTHETLKFEKNFLYYVHFSGKSLGLGFISLKELAETKG